jgi:hypothetical protein
MLSLVGCDFDKQKHQKEQFQYISTQFYKETNENNSDTYVELKTLSISKDNELVFIANLMDPFSNEKLEVSIVGIAIRNDIGVFEVSGKKSKNINIFTYTEKEDGHIYCLFSTKQEVEKRFLGQWSLSALPR